MYFSIQSLNRPDGEGEREPSRGGNVYSNEWNGKLLKKLISYQLSNHLFLLPYEKKWRRKGQRFRIQAEYDSPPEYADEKNQTQEKSLLQLLYQTKCIAFKTRNKLLLLNICQKTKNISPN